MSGRHIENERSRVDHRDTDNAKFNTSQLTQITVRAINVPSQSTISLIVYFVFSAAAAVATSRQ